MIRLALLAMLVVPSGCMVIPSVDPETRKVLMETVQSWNVEMEADEPELELGSKQSLFIKLHNAKVKTRMAGTGDRNDWAQLPPMEDTLTDKSPRMTTSRPREYPWAELLSNGMTAIHLAPGKTRYYPKFEE